MSRKNQTGISDEELIAALISTGTIKAAAQAAGIGERTFYTRMKSGEFQALYKAAKADTIRAAVNALNARTQAAIDTIAEIMEAQDVNPATRLQAAQTILNHAGRFADRLQAAEQSVQLQEEQNMIFGM